MRSTGRHILAWALPLAWSAAALAQPPRISEIRIASSGMAAVRYFELAGPPGLFLHGMTYLAIGDGVVEEAIDLDGLVIPPDGYLLVSEVNLEPQTDRVARLDFEHDGNVTHLLVDGFRGAKGDDLGAGDDGTFDVTPWRAILRRFEWNDLVDQPDSPGGRPTVPKHAYQCLEGDWRAGAADPDIDDTPGRPGCCFWPGVWQGEFQIEVWEKPGRRRETRPVSSLLLSIVGDERESICEDCASATVKRCCAAGETLKAEPGDQWYYHSRALACTEPNPLLAVKRRRHGISSRFGRANPAVLDLSFEYRFSCDLGLEVAGIFADAEPGGAVPRRIWAVALNAHPMPKGPVDFYFGPLIGYLSYDDVLVATVARPRPVAIDDKVALGVNLGLSVPLPRRSYGITLGARYLARSSSVAARGAIEPDGDLFEVSAGLTWRF